MCTQKKVSIYTRTYTWTIFFCLLSNDKDALLPLFSQSRWLNLIVEHQCRGKRNK
jgi:hypothetical protein